MPVWGGELPGDVVVRRSKINLNFGENNSFDVTTKLILGRRDGAVVRPIFGGRVVHCHNIEMPVIENRRADLLAETQNGDIHYLEVDTQNHVSVLRRMGRNYLHLEEQFPGKRIRPVLW